jgi:hypothetical protein
VWLIVTRCVAVAVANIADFKWSSEALSEGRQQAFALHPACCTVHGTEAGYQIPQAQGRGNTDQYIFTPSIVSVTYTYCSDTVTCL